MKYLFIILGLLSVPTPAMAQHRHISAQTQEAGATDKLQIVTYGDTSSFSGPNNLLMLNGSPIVYTLASGPVTGGLFAGFMGGAAPTLTTDLVNIPGADVQYEFTGISIVSGQPGNVIAYVVPESAVDGVAYQDAFTNGAAQADRTLDYGMGNHWHGVTLYSLLPGTYDVTLTAFDANNNYLPSDPVSFRVTAVPEPAGAMLIGVGMFLLRRKKGDRCMC